MTEPRLARIVEFKPRKKANSASPIRPADTPNNGATVVDLRDRLPALSATPDTHDYFGIIIPSTDSLYNPDQISIRGQTIEEALALVRSLPDPDEALNAEYNLEQRLLAARATFIRENITSDHERKAARRELVSHTLGVADELLRDENDRYRDKLRRSVLDYSDRNLNPAVTKAIVDKHDLIASIHAAERRGKFPNQPVTSSRQRLLTVVE